MVLILEESKDHSQGTRGTLHISEPDIEKIGVKGKPGTYFFVLTFCPLSEGNFWNPLNSNWITIYMDYKIRCSLDI